jgi:hypothetical protein
MEGLPVYYLELNEGDGLTQVSLVSSPAIEENFHAFNAQDQPFTFAIQSEEKHIITGPAMLAEKPIYRRGPDGSEFMVKFSAATIEKAVRMWATQGKYNAVNAEHSSPVGGLFLLESFITDPVRGINPPEAWKDAPAGSWFLSYYVQDDALWAKVKSGEFKGFSIEGYFTDRPADEDAEAMAAIHEILSNYSNNMDHKSTIGQIRALLGFSEQAPAAPAGEPAKFGEGTLADGTVIRWQGETLESGALLEVQTPEGEFVPAPDGTHETADGQLVTTEGGIVTEIMLKEGEEMPDGEDMKAEFSALKSEYAAKFEAQEAALAKLAAAIDRLTTAQGKTLEVIEQFSAIPAAEPVKKPQGFGRTAQSTEDRLAKVAENLRNLKNNK